MLSTIQSKGIVEREMIYEVYNLSIFYIYLDQNIFNLTRSVRVLYEPRLNKQCKLTRKDKSVLSREQHNKLK